jgi:hypothetical protein
MGVKGNEGRLRSDKFACAGHTAGTPRTSKSSAAQFAAGCFLRGLVGSLPNLMDLDPRYRSRAGVDGLLFEQRWLSEYIAC